MRVLMSSSAGYGHVLPMVPLARALVAAGHEVLWATARDAVQLVAAAGLPAASAGLTRAEILPQWTPFLEQAESLPPDERPTFMFPKLFGRIRPPRMASDLLRIAQDWHPDLLVHEQGELAAPLVAAVIGIPAVVHAFGGPVPPDHLAAAGEELAPLWAEHGLTPPPYAGCFETLYLDILPPSLQGSGVSHIPTVQPLRPVPYTGEAAAEPELPPGDAPVVYLTLGTVFNPAHVLTAALDGLAELDVRVVATVGPAGDPDAVGPRPANVRVDRYVSQTALLPHCAAVVSHAGSGTTLGALSLGLPKVCLPQAADQFRNAQAVTAAGAGLSLHPDRSTAEAIATAVADVLEQPGYRAGARRVADEIAAMPSPEQVVPVLEGLVSSRA